MAAKKHTVLIIEDNELNRDILQTILEDDYQLLTAENGKIGLEMMHEHASEIDIVLLDIQMPVMDGYEVLEAVSKDSAIRHIPIIVTTGADSIEDEERCLSLLATEFIRKPYNPGVVRLRIQSLIRMRDFAATLTDVEIDKFTGAYTRNAFMHYAQEWINSQPDIDFSLTMTDVRGFHILREKYGNRAYDLLKKIIIAIQSSIDGKCIAGAYSEDQLIFLHPTQLQNLNDDEKQKWYDDSMLKLSEELSISIKAGICENLDTSMELTTHVDNVHAALREAKKAYNRQAHFVGKDLLDNLHRQARMEELMEEALASGQMKVYYQPKHDARTEKLVGAEALLRWFSPELGFVSPGDFIPLFERNGFVSEADAFVWTETCKNQRKWQDMGLKVVPISVNTSRHDYTQDDIYERIVTPVIENNINEKLMHIEVTESLFTNLSDGAIEVLQQFRDKNIMVELDDFGTGYSSLNSLSQLPIDIVKFDMPFVRKINEPRNEKVMRGCVSILKELNLKSVAEGVEDADTQQKIAEMGIDYIQGYYYSKPLPAAEFEEYLSKHAV